MVRSVTTIPHNLVAVSVLVRTSAAGIHAMNKSSWLWGGIWLTLGHSNPTWKQDRDRNLSGSWLLAGSYWLAQPAFL